MVLLIVITVIYGQSVKRTAENVSVWVVIIPEIATRGHTCTTNSQGESEHQVHWDLCVVEVIKRAPSSLFLAEVWEKEFDPIMVILRTVYRRDVQSAMDRYSAL